MRKMVTITIEGDAKTGKSTIAAIIEDRLKEYLVAVLNQDHSDGVRTKQARRALPDLCSVVIVTQLSKGGVGA